METDRKYQIVRRLYILSIINLVASVAALIIGAFAVSTSDSKFPYNAGGAIIGGSMTIFLSCCPCYIHSKYSKHQEAEFGCSLLCMVIWFSIAILALPLGLGMSGIYGLVECSKPNGGSFCYNQTDTKIVLCVFTMLVTSLLIIVDLCLFFTCCCNSATLGLPLLNETPDFHYTPRNIDQVRREIEAERDFRRYVRNTRPTAPPVNRADTVYSVDGTGTVSPVPPVQNVELNFGLDEANVTYSRDTNRRDDTPPAYHSNRTNTRLDDPPPSYEEVMRTT